VDDVRLTVAIIGVGGVVLGAVIAGTLSLVTGLQSRRWAHQQWILDRRLETYSAFVQAHVRLGTGHPEQEDVTAAIAALLACTVISSYEVDTAAEPYIAAARTHARAPTPETLSDLHQAGAHLRATMSFDVLPGRDRRLRRLTNVWDSIRLGRAEATPGRPSTPPN
jgi:5-carboxymethyl-2-hydroxymuconate isomerase